MHVIIVINARQLGLGRRKMSSSNYYFQGPEQYWLLNLWRAYVPYAPYAAITNKNSKLIIIDE